MFVIGCGGGSGGTGEDVDADLLDSGGTDTGGAEVEVDTGTEEDTSFVLDTGAPDTGRPETAADTSIPDTAVDPDTGAADSGTVDTGTVDPDTGTVDSGTPDTGTPDTGMVDTGASCVVGAACDDGNACTSGDKFDATCACTGTAVVCDDTNVCTTDTCVPATGCKFTPVGDGTSCGAGKKCTTGVCGDLCTVGAACNDGDACTTGEKFDATCACTGGTAVTCDDSNPCTADSCVPATGCATTPSNEGLSPAGCAAPSTCKAGVCTAPPTPPTVTINTPTAGGSYRANDKSDACAFISTSVSFTAPAGFKEMRWRFITPTTGNGGQCNGLPAYGYFIDHRDFTGLTSGTMTENV